MRFEKINAKFRYYKKKTKLFKINPVCNELINIPEDFNSNFLSTDYSKFSGIELYSSTGTYNQNLSLNQVLTHPAWITALENDKTLLKEYAEITFYILKTKNKIFNIGSGKPTSINQLCEEIKNIKPVKKAIITMPSISISFSPKYLSASCPAGSSSTTNGSKMIGKIMPIVSHENPIFVWR